MGSTVDDTTFKPHFLGGGRRQLSLAPHARRCRCTQVAAAHTHRMIRGRWDVLTAAKCGLIGCDSRLLG